MNLSLGDPTMFKDFETNQEVLKLCAQGVGKIDGYTNFLGDPKIRKYLADQYSNENFKLSEDDVILTFGVSLSLWIAIAVLCD